MCSGPLGGRGGEAPRRRHAVALGAPERLPRGERGQESSEPRGRSRPGGGVGATPPQKENPRAGGWARAPAGYPRVNRSTPAHARPGWGRGELRPPQETRGCPRSALTPALSLGERGQESLGAAGALPTRRGRGGAAPHRERNPRAGGWARAALRGIPASTEAPLRTLVRDGGVGGASPPQETRGRPRSALTPTLSPGRGGRRGGRMASGRGTPARGARRRS